MALGDFDTTLVRHFGFEFDSNLFEEVQSISFGKMSVAKVEVPNVTKDGLNVKKVMPGKEEYGDVSIVAYVTDKIQALIDEFEMAKAGDLPGARKGASIVVMDSLKQPVMRYELINAFISGIAFSDMDGKADSPALCTVTFTPEEVKVKKA